LIDGPDGEQQVSFVDSHIETKDIYRRRQTRYPEFGHWVSLPIDLPDFWLWKMQAQEDTVIYNSNSGHIPR
jgi:hypothetical protein